ncbi:hypothetical protein O9992_19900 [Vibrio lentus]|nr:hypothetical protein [Vibrio lentus]
MVSIAMLFYWAIPVCASAPDHGYRIRLGVSSLRVGTKCASNFEGTEQAFKTHYQQRAQQHVRMTTKYHTPTQWLTYKKENQVQPG